MKIKTIDRINKILDFDDGTSYPLMDDLEDISLNEFQKYVDFAEHLTQQIIKKFGDIDG